MNGDNATKLNAKSIVRAGVTVNAIIIVCLRGMPVTYLPTTRATKISVNPSTRLLKPKLYPISLIAYSIP